MKKPVCKLTNENGNIYNLTAIAANALKRANMRDAAKEMKAKLSQSSNYDAALMIIQEYVDVE